MIKKILYFYRSSIRNKLLIALPLSTALFLLFPSILSIFALRKQLIDNVPVIGGNPSALHHLLVVQTVTLVLISFLAIGALAIFVGLLAYAIAHPITELARETEKMAQGKRDLKPLPYEGPDEVGRLAQSINHFIRTIDKIEKEKEKDAALAAIGRMSAELAHEIRNPIGSIDIFCQLVPERWEDKTFHEKFAKTVPYELSRIKNLVNELLEVARPIHLQFRNVDAGEVLLKTAAEYQNGKYPGLRLKVEMEEGDWNIIADEFALVRVFKNLVQNAVQAMEANGRIEIVLKKVEDESNDEKVVLSVNDTGPGMNEETLERIFEPFFTRKEGGTGLGLAICKKIVNGHGGSINVTSLLGKGTTFLVELPVRQAAPV